MADVYLAEDERLGRQVAVKVLKARLAADDEFVERFRIEAQAAASLNHPSIVAVYDRGTAEGTTYIAMEYVRGETLKQRLRRDGALPPDEAVPIALAVLSALSAAHARAIVHRDVTSYNVMLDQGGRVVVTDFGIARMGDSALTRTGAMMGTSSYLSPEQAQGRQADERSDLYSLGVVLYEMLTGRVPFRGETDVAVAMQHVSTAPPNPRTLAPGVSEALAGAAMRALSKNPDDRYQTAEDFAAALRKARRPARAPGDGAGAPGAPATAGAAGAAGAAGVGVLAATAGVAAAGAAPVRRLRRPAARPPRPRPSRRARLLRRRPSRRRRRRRCPPRRPWSPRRRPPAISRAASRPRACARGAAAECAAQCSPSSCSRWWPPGPGRRTSTCSPPARRSPPWSANGGLTATRALRDEGLKPALHYVWADKYASGEVARQSPRGGAKVDDGVKVDLWVSRGPLHIPSPDLSGLAAGVARGRLQAESLNSKSRRAASETTPKGQIFKQQPAAGATVKRGDTVTFWVSSGPPKVYVPDVVGLSQGDASAVLEDAGFVVSTDYVAGWGEMPGTVVGQDPVAEHQGQGRRRGRDPGRRVLTAGAGQPVRPGRVRGSTAGSSQASGRW